MKVSKKQAQQNREAVVEIAGRLFRERGFDGIGVADLMRSAGLTHGGFYASFGSKEALMAEASSRALQQNVVYWQEFKHKESPVSLPNLMQDYLQQSYLTGCADGCLISALGSEVARKPEVVKQPVTEGVKSIIEAIQHLIPVNSSVQQRQQAIAAYASSVGALILARAVSDKQLSEEILKAVVAAMPA